jgi:putative transposase
VALCRATILYVTTRNFTFAEGEFYHVYNRGVEKRVIFLDEFDRRRFTELLYAANSHQPIDLRYVLRTHSSIFDWDRGEPLVAIGAYCLMNNHFHILLTPLEEGGVSKFMNKLCTSYSMYFNRKYKRTGALFEGKFKAKHATSDEYLKYLFAYIHLNPIKQIQPDWKEQGIKDVSAAYEHISNYKYSSFVDYQAVLRPERCIINSHSFPEYFLTINDHKQELIEWLSFSELANLE